MQDPGEPQLSKTRRKKDMHALQALGEQLVVLTAAQLAGLELPERLLDAIEHAKRITGFEARRRQMQYIGRLMREVDAAPIAARLSQLKTAAKRENARHHEVEYWRDRLLAEEAALTELARAQSISLVLDATDGNVVYADRALDLTDEVLTRLNQMPVTGTPPPAKQN